MILTSVRHLIWKSNISKDTKLAFFRDSVESILLYGPETWKDHTLWLTYMET